MLQTDRMTACRIIKYPMQVFVSTLFPWVPLQLSVLIHSKCQQPQKLQLTNNHLIKLTWRWILFLFWATEISGRLWRLESRWEVEVNVTLTNMHTSLLYQWSQTPDKKIWAALHEKVPLSYQKKFWHDTDFLDFFVLTKKMLISFYEKTVSYQKKDGRGNMWSSFFWYDNDSRR